MLEGIWRRIACYFVLSLQWIFVCYWWRRLRQFACVGYSLASFLSEWLHIPQEASNFNRMESLGRKPLSQQLNGWVGLHMGSRQDWRRAGQTWLPRWTSRVDIPSWNAPRQSNWWCLLVSTQGSGENGRLCRCVFLVLGLASNQRSLCQWQWVHRKDRVA